MQMKKVLEHRISKLKSRSFSEIDHIEILQDIYDDYKDGKLHYYLIARYFISGLDEVPSLTQKENWNDAAFEKARKIFYNSHHKLVEIINTYYEIEEDEELKQEFHTNENLKLIWIEKNGIKNGVFKRYFDDTRIAYISEYKNGKNIGIVKEWYPNGQIAEKGKYINGEYIVENFWDENGKQLLKEGTGKAIRKFGTNGYDVYEQYFQNYEFKGEKKISGISFGKFEENKNET